MASGCMLHIKQSQPMNSDTVLRTVKLSKRSRAPRSHGNTSGFSPASGPVPGYPKQAAQLAGCRKPVQPNPCRSPKHKEDNRETLLVELVRKNNRNKMKEEEGFGIKEHRVRREHITMQMSSYSQCFAKYALLRHILYYEEYVFPNPESQSRAVYSVSC